MYRNIVTEMSPDRNVQWPKRPRPKRQDRIVQTEKSCTRFSRCFERPKRSLIFHQWSLKTRGVVGWKRLGTAFKMALKSSFDQSLQHL